MCVSLSFGKLYRTLDCMHFNPSLHLMNTITLILDVDDSAPHHLHFGLPLNAHLPHCVEPKSENWVRFKWRPTDFVIGEKETWKCYFLTALSPDSMGLESVIAVIRDAALTLAWTRLSMRHCSQVLWFASSLICLYKCAGNLFSMENQYAHIVKDIQHGLGIGVSCMLASLLMFCIATFYQEISSCLFLCNFPHWDQFSKKQSA